MATWASLDAGGRRHRIDISPTSYIESHLRCWAHAGWSITVAIAKVRLRCLQSLELWYSDREVELREKTVVLSS